MSKESPCDNAFTLIGVRWTERRSDVRLDLIARQFLEEVAERAKRFTYSRVKLSSLFSSARVNRFVCSCEEVGRIPLN
jgi:hypothetical protein